MQYRLYEDSHGKKQQVFGVSIWLTEFCLEFGIQIITPADTLFWNNIISKNLVGVKVEDSLSKVENKPHDKKNS